MTEKFEKALNNKLGIIVAIVFIITAIVSIVMAFSVRATEINVLKTDMQKQEECLKKLDDKKVDKAIYDIDIKYIKDGIDEIKKSLRDK